MNEEASPNESGTIKVWDPVVRIGHWLIVAGVLTAYFTGDDVPTLHVWAGYTVAVVVLVRLIWGVVGTRHARFASFVRGPAAARAYFSRLVKGTAKRSLGHNPAGAIMIVALLLALAGTTGSGMTLLALDEGRGPLAPLIASSTISETVADASAWSGEEDDGEHGRHNEADEHDADGYEGGVVGTVHKVFVYLTLGLALLHVVGVVWSSVAHRENLVAAMVTGRKRR
jgi:cytochrome b